MTVNMDFAVSGNDGKDGILLLRGMTAKMESCCCGE